ncbi:MAG TPA: hypothetical protein VHN59_18620 [Chitinophagaceae bacterium]|nr:hypothetical protein [Chitinophagaceae bacterium]
MHISSDQLNARLQSLTESNEQLLKSKARLQQDLLSMKKSLVEKEQAIQNVTDLVGQRVQQLAASEQLIKELRAVNQRQAAQLTEMQDKIELLEKEQQRLQGRSWWQRLFGQ